MKQYIVCALLLSIAGTLSAGVQLPYIERQPEEADYAPYCAYAFPGGQPKENVYAPEELDVRSCDLSQWDLSSYTARELSDVLTFDSKTLFPSADRLPLGFDPEVTLLHGTDPGLYVRELHRQGIDGRGVAVAIVDQNLLTTHQEYAHNLVWYQELADFKDMPADLGATGAASILVGRTVGVAPRAKLFHFAVKAKEKDGYIDAMPFADALGTILEMNAKVPEQFRIKVVSIAVEFNPQDNGYEAFNAARRKLEKNGTVVFTANPVFPLSRIHAWDNPNNERRYCRPATWLAKTEYDKEYENTGRWRLLLAPSDYRVVAAPNGPEDYVQYAQGGEAWSVPYVAGLYALGLQVYPQLTRRQFYKAWVETAADRTCIYDGVKYDTANFPRPVQLMRYLGQLSEGKTPDVQDLQESVLYRQQGQPARTGPRAPWRKYGLHRGNKGGAVKGAPAKNQRTKKR